MVAQVYVGYTISIMKKTTQASKTPIWKIFTITGLAVAVWFLLFATSSTVMYQMLAGVNYTGIPRNALGQEIFFASLPFIAFITTSVVLALPLFYAYRFIKYAHPSRAAIATFAGLISALALFDIVLILLQKVMPIYNTEWPWLVLVLCVGAFAALYVWLARTTSVKGKLRIMVMIGIPAVIAVADLLLRLAPYLW